MSVLLETSLGDLVVDLDTERCPRTCTNFLKLCKAYRYNYLTFFSVQKGFLAQTGDPTNSGSGGQSVWSLLPPDAPEFSKVPFFKPERHGDLKHKIRGTLSMACRRLVADDEDSLVAGSQFFVTLDDSLDYLDGKHAPFGYVVEGLEKGEALGKINDAFVDEKDKRPLRDIRLQHAVVLDDPFEDPQGLHMPSRTPSPTPEQLKPIGLDASAAVEESDAERDPEEVEEERRKRDAKSNALTLEMIGDLPFAEIRPPENILFVCQLNPVTRSEDLELIFSRFGKILSCDVIKDKRTGDSLQYAFIEFDEQESAEQAYLKMQNVLVDDRRIQVDFSQSVSRLSSDWNKSRAGGKPLRISKHANGRDRQGGSRDAYTKDMVFDFDQRSSRNSNQRREGAAQGGRDARDRGKDRYHPYDREGRGSRGEYRDEREDRYYRSPGPRHEARHDRHNDFERSKSSSRQDGERRREYRGTDRDRREERRWDDRARSPRRDAGATSRRYR